MQALVINKKIFDLTKCHTSSHIVNQLEYWFKKHSNGFWKFLEPCTLSFYKKGDSWTEEIGCSRRKFNKYFERYAIRYVSRTEFLASEDKFQGKLYASYYDRYTNRMFFVRNHEIADAFFNSKDPKKDISKNKNDHVPPENIALGNDKKAPKKHLGNDTNGHSYNEPITTSIEISKDISHAGNEIVKKMIEIWTACEGKPVDHSNTKLIPFLKKAFIDKFGRSLEKWKRYCERIASSKFLMGEKNSFRATLDWALKFDTIRKVLDGSWYGIGDREPKYIYSQPDVKNIKEEIIKSEEHCLIKKFRIKCIETVGLPIYISWFKNLKIDFIDEHNQLKVFTTRFICNYLDGYFSDVIETVLKKTAINQSLDWKYGEFINP